MPEFEIQLSNVMLYANHGVMAAESVTGNQYRINVRLRIDADTFDADKDDLHSTISYADLFDIINSLMQRRCALLETIAVKFATEVKSRWPHLKGGEIEIVKTTPPIPHMIGEAGVKYLF